MRPTIEETRHHWYELWKRGSKYADILQALLSFQRCWLQHCKMELKNQLLQLKGLRLICTFMHITATWSCNMQCHTLEIVTQKCAYKV